LVAFALAHAEAVVAGGRSLHAASKELGVNMMTLQSWQRQARGCEPARLREVVVAAPKPLATTPQGTLTLTTSSGHIVRGLDAAQAVALLRALS
jgi:transposase-like protein